MIANVVCEPDVCAPDLAKQKRNLDDHRQQTIHYNAFAGNCLCGLIQHVMGVQTSPTPRKMQRAQSDRASALEKL